MKFISCDVRGVFSYTFCDFGDQFDVLDADGEEVVELFIADITKVCAMWSTLTSHNSKQIPQIITQPCL